VNSACDCEFVKTHSMRRAPAIAGAPLQEGCGGRLLAGEGGLGPQDQPAGMAARPLVAEVEGAVLGHGLSSEEGREPDVLGLDPTEPTQEARPSTR